MTDMTPASPTPVAKAKPRPRPQVMKLTEAAAQRVRELTSRADSVITRLASCAVASLVADARRKSAAAAIR